MDDDSAKTDIGVSRHVSRWIDASPEAVYDFLADPRTWPAWAAGLAAGELRQSPQGWLADSPMGTVVVEFSAPNTFGVLDHVVRLPSGEAVYNPFRILPAGPGEPRCEVVFSVRQRGMTDDEFEADIAAVAADLDALRRLVEGQRQDAQ
ncbi:MULTISPECIES: SRPBCC family protein [Mycobacteriaceae]|uniref:SRPBCC family protein n=1 Tax=Mycobacteriaceae TaxID=1762 RepID=UPI000800E880|nr:MULTISPECIES: SRPBCC family protein [Mycobacteriaceae]MCK0175151.1 SRPBCC family protein [Mycolicibacterium sp. F2034L]OBB59690.1 polyketide cyclase [Mycobacterium sp. 852013-51886_SCH5428379]